MTTSLAIEQRKILMTEATIYKKVVRALKEQAEHHSKSAADLDALANHPMAWDNATVRAELKDASRRQERKAVELGQIVSRIEDRRDKERGKVIFT